jgi:hypothetical protein
LEIIRILCTAVTAKAFIYLKYLCLLWHSFNTF